MSVWQRILVVIAMGALGVLGILSATNTHVQPVSSIALSAAHDYHNIQDAPGAHDYH